MCNRIHTCESMISHVCTRIHTCAPAFTHVCPRSHMCIHIHITTCVMCPQTLQRGAVVQTRLCGTWYCPSCSTHAGKQTVEKISREGLQVQCPIPQAIP